jgi:hypothetical protein
MIVCRIFRLDAKGEFRPVRGLLYAHRASALRAIKRIRRQLRVVAANVP